MRELFVGDGQLLADARVFIRLRLGALVRALECHALLVELERLPDEPPRVVLRDDIERA